MYYTYVTARCPNCKRILYIKITKLMWLIRVNSGLGPNFVVCSSCNTKMMTNNKEWQQMSLSEKLWYLILSLFYGIVLGFMSSMTIGLAVGKVFGYELSPELIGILIVAPVVLIVFAIQGSRILLSLERTENNRESKKTISFWDWETNLQFYGGMWILLAVFGAIPFLELVLKGYKIVGCEENIQPI